MLIQVLLVGTQDAIHYREPHGELELGGEGQLSLGDDLGSDPVSHPLRLTENPATILQNLCSFLQSPAQWLQLYPDIMAFWILQHSVQYVLTRLEPLDCSLIWGVIQRQEAEVEVILLVHVTETLQRDQLGTRLHHNDYQDSLKYKWQ